MNMFKFKRLLFDGLCWGYLFSVFWIWQFVPSQELLFQQASNTILFFGFVMMAVVLSEAINKFGIRTLGEVLFQSPVMKANHKVKPWYQSFWGFQLAVTFLVTFVVSLKTTHFSFCELVDPDGFAGAMRLFKGLATPNFAIVSKAILAIFETIFIAFLATVLAVPVAFVLGFVCAKNIMGQNPLGFFVYNFLRTVLNFTRSIEALIWAIIFSVWVGIGPFAGMLALMVHSVASLAKQYSEYVECVDEGPLEGIVSTGAHRLQVIWFGIVPQVTLPFISYTIYRWDINVRMATIIGLVGGGGIGTLLIQYQGQMLWNEVGCIVLVIAVAVWALDTSSAYIREAIK